MPPPLQIDRLSWPTTFWGIVEYYVLGEKLRTSRHPFQESASRSSLRFTPLLMKKKSWRYSTVDMRSLGQEGLFAHDASVRGSSNSVIPFLPTKEVDSRSLSGRPFCYSWKENVRSLQHTPCSPSRSFLRCGGMLSVEYMMSRSPPLRSLLQQQHSLQSIVHCMPKGHSQRHPGGSPSNA